MSLPWFFFALFRLQAAAKLSSGLVSSVWEQLDQSVVTPALEEYLSKQQPQQHEEEEVKQE